MNLDPLVCSFPCKADGVRPAMPTNHLPGQLLQVTGYNGPAALNSALKDAKVVLIPAGVPRKPGELDLF